MSAQKYVALGFRQMQQQQHGGSAKSAFNFQSDGG
jgi:hypothetical protein